MTNDAERPRVPGLYFDDETTQLLEDRLAGIEQLARTARRELRQRAPCNQILVTTVRLRGDVTSLVALSFRAHLETCIAQCVRAGEGSAALASVEVALRDLLERL
ncbi:MAG: hypothetical protein HYV20_07705 [Gemmatimonadetes bacterium]|nr:hypothetical protein [Gemmatimonadota bacterium]